MISSPAAAAAKARARGLLKREEVRTTSRDGHGRQEVRVACYCWKNGHKQTFCSSRCLLFDHVSRAYSDGTTRTAGSPAAAFSCKSRGVASLASFILNSSSVLLVIHSFIHSFHSFHSAAATVYSIVV